MKYYKVKHEGDQWNLGIAYSKGKRYYWIGEPRAINPKSQEIVAFQEVSFSEAKQYLEQNLPLTDIKGLEDLQKLVKREFYDNVLEEE
jgi:hypothetical protein